MRYLLIYIFVIIIIYWSVTIVRTPPTNFPVGEIFLVDEGESLRSVSKRLEDKHIIKSAILFRVWLSFEGKDKNLQLGYYTFDKPLVLGAVLKRMTVTGPDMPLTKATIPEGSTSKEIATIIKNVLPSISIDKFMQIVSDKKADGYLFPSTYFLLPSSDEEKIIDKMLANFNKEYDENFKYRIIPKDLKDKNEIISLAAILEGEAKSKEDMKIVSGILQKRLALNMALQVDVAPETYKTKGVPIIPVSNPGSVAITSVFEPMSTGYLFYLTGRDGKMYYAKTFAEHKLNIKKYLK